MQNNLYLFTYSFPYGHSEPFLLNEIEHLANNFKTVYIIPLQQDRNIKDIPPNVEVLSPLVSFDVKKNKLKLIINGIFNTSPWLFAYKEWKQKKVYKSRTKMRVFFTFLLLFRNMYKNLQINFTDDDIIYFYWGDKSIMLAPSIKQHCKANIIVRLHNSDLYENIKSCYIPFRNQNFATIDKFVCISENGRQYLLNEYPNIVEEKKTFVSRLGVYDNGQNADKNCATFHLVSCSNIVAIKRIELIINTLLHVNFKLIWSHIGDGPLKSKMQAISKSLPENITVEWLGQKTNSEVLRYYKDNHVDLFLNVSSSEGIPVSIMEAMSFGIPCMATDVGGVSELVNNDNGILLPSNPEASFIAIKINEFALNTNQNLRINARKYYEQHYDANTNYKNFVKILKD